MEKNVLKGAIAALSTILTYLCGNFTPLIFVMILFEAMDYITGIISAYQYGGVSSHEAVLGFIKKISYFFLVAVAFLFDFMIVEVTRLLGFDFEWQAIFGIMSVCYLISTEGISILENLSEIGLEIPFLTMALKIFKEKVDKEASGKRTK